MPFWNSMKHLSYMEVSQVDRNFNSLTPRTLINITASLGEIKSLLLTSYLQLTLQDLKLLSDLTSKKIETPKAWQKLNATETGSKVYLKFIYILSVYTDWIYKLIDFLVETTLLKQHFQTLSSRRFPWRFQDSNLYVTEIEETIFSSFYGRSKISRQRNFAQQQYKFVILILLVGD